MARGIVSLLALALHVISANASSGDRDITFTICVERCEADGPSGPREQPYAMFWSVRDECRYSCMEWIERARQTEMTESQYHPHKYYGKWPIVRMAGMQEPASAIFSLLNLVAHAHGIRAYLRVAPVTHYMRGMWMVYALLACATWLASFIFHSRDVYLTEQFDYHLAQLAIAWSTVCAVVRVCELRSLAARAAAATLVMGADAYHIANMISNGIDYGLNMKVAAIMWISAIVLWTGWGWLATVPDRTGTQSRRPFAWKIDSFHFLLIPAASLEVWDFPPVWHIFDAHALWHLATAPLTILLWHIHCCDVSYDAQTSKRVGQLDDASALKTV